MKRLLVLVLFGMVLLPAGIRADDASVAIIILKSPQSEQQIKELLKPFPNVKLRRIFREAITGFSVEGSQAAIAGLNQSHEILAISPVNNYQAEMEENVKIIGGEEVRRLNRTLTGKGITVGVIDTGIDYTHPDLRANFHGGHDLVDGDDDPMETKSNAPGKSTLHGTHVAGIIAANGKIKGVAPDAKIIAYRALGPGGSGTTEQVLAAIEQAIKDKVDIVNLSLGDEINGPDLPISLALNRAVDKGMIAVAAAGNAGPNNWTVGSPGTAAKAISVGASTPTMEVPTLLIEEKRQKIRIEPLTGSRNWTTERSVELVDGGLGTKKEVTHAAGKIALIKRGGLSFTEKAKNAAAAGAVGVLIYNNTSGGFTGNLQELVTIPVGSLSKGVGDFLKKHGLPLTVRLEMEVEKDRLADFSSRGPVTVTWDVKPDVVAPGVAIESTVPGGYLALKGTSMAAPHVAGACALIKEAHPDWTPAEVKAALMNTAKPLRKNGGDDYHAYEQGAGRIQVDKAVKAGTLVLPSSVQFGKFQLADSLHRHKAYLLVENKSGVRQRYSFAVPERRDGLLWKVPLPFTLAPGEKREVEVEIAVEPEFFRKKIYDGAIRLLAGAEEIRIPYVYVLEEPDYPRVMGFELTKGDQPGTYRYEVYLPGGAEEFGIALFSQADYRFVGYLDTDRNVKKGLLSKQIAREKLPPPGTYVVKVFAKKAQKEDRLETTVMFGKEKEE
ncbi:S8 family serine peptidase [Neobacillus sp. SM06]|uniref:S8 family serine peptidase n=1 Tax=Neobacillus sp. SM06 TaxID=3422492 RepID=UPI003D2BE9AF